MKSKGPLFSQPKSPPFLVVLLGLVLILYSATLNFPFVALDDSKHIWQNPYIRNFSWDRLWFFWKDAYYGLFIPITYNIWGIITKATEIMGLTHPITDISAFLFHLTNVTLHTTNTYLVYKLLKKIHDYLHPSPSHSSISQAVLILAVTPFALHPMQVESVAWVSGLKDVLSSLFALLSLHFFLDAQGEFKNSTQKKSKSTSKSSDFNSKALLGSFIFLFLALLAKPSHVILAPSMAILVLALRGVHLKSKPLMVFFAASLAVGLWLTLKTRAAQPLSRMDFELSTFNQIQLIFSTFGFYLGKIFYPALLAPDYGLTPPRLLNSSLHVLHLILSLLWISSLGIYLKYKAAWSRFLLIGQLWFIIGLLPVSGILPFEFQNLSSVADRYVYFLPMIGICLTLIPLLDRTYLWWIDQKKSKQRFFNFGAISVVGSMVILTFLQILYWKDNESLFKRVIEVNPASYLAYSNLGLHYLREEKWSEAEMNLHLALNAKDDYLPAIANMGALYFKQKNFNKVVSFYTEYFKKLEPAGPGSSATYADMYFNLGAASINLGQIQEGFLSMKKATQINPDHFSAQLYAGKTAFLLKNLSTADWHYRQALRLKPQDPQVIQERDLLRRALTNP